MEKLTPKEIAIFDYLKEGYENHEIAKKIFVSKNTVKSHISHMMHKMNARNRTHLVYLASKQGLIKEAQLACD
jgi:DNA-binding NarL/FixJ family response regulator